jgi:hypothetical protein
MLLYTDALRVAIGLIGVAVAAVIALWHKILDWAQDSLFPWIEKNLPSILSTIKDAFEWVDNNVIVPTRRLVKGAWKSLRKTLLKMVIQLERRDASKWERRITSFVVEALTPQSPVVKKVETVEEVDWDDLPDDVRSAWMKNEQQSHDMDVTAIREQQLETLEMTN